MKKSLYLLPFVLGSCFLIIGTLSDSYVDSKGYLHEPYFFMTPLGYLFIIVGFLAIIMRTAAFYMKKKRFS